MLHHNLALSEPILLGPDDDSCMAVVVFLYMDGIFPNSNGVKGIDYAKLFASQGKLRRMRRGLR